MAFSSDSEEISKALMKVSEDMTQVIEVSEGLRRQLEERGWSPTMAEAAAYEFMSGLMRVIFK